jgi:hypothetical protein
MAEASAMSFSPKSSAFSGGALSSLTEGEVVDVDLDGLDGLDGLDLHEVHDEEELRNSILATKKTTEHIKCHPSFERAALIIQAGISLLCCFSFVCSWFADMDADRAGNVRVWRNNTLYFEVRRDEK